MLNKPWRFYMYYSKGFPRLLARIKYTEFGIDAPDNFHFIISPFRWHIYASITKYARNYHFGPFRLIIYRW